MTIPTPLEIAAVLFILANVWLATKENIWTWPTGIVGVVLYTIVNYKAKLYANAGLQVVYFVLSIHGWYEWLHGGVNKSELHVRRTTPRQWVGCAIASVVLTAAVMQLLRWSHDSQQTFLDSSTTALSLVGQWMMNEKLLENWWLWLAADVGYVAVFWVKGLHLSAALYVVFFGLCVAGVVEWRRTMRAQGAAPVVA